MPFSDSPETLIKETAYEIGFSHVGIAGISKHVLSKEIFDKWLDEGKNGDMHFLSKRREKRQDPTLLLEGARSAICLAVNYYTEALEENNRIGWGDGRGIFSIYAHGRDYHSVLGEMLSALEKKLRELFPRIQSVSCVDTKPVSDREFAIQSGIAWLGKNTNVFSPEYGSWIFLGELITDLELVPDSPLESLCGSCMVCIDSCPTGALGEEYVLDANKCISYLTIAKLGKIQNEFHDSIGLNIYGCDICQHVCPYNAVAKRSVIFSSEERSPLVDMKLENLARIEKEVFEELTRDSVIKWCKVERLRRNAEIALKNVSSLRPSSEEEIR